MKPYLEAVQALPGKPATKTCREHIYFQINMRGGMGGLWSLKKKQTCGERERSLRSGHCYGYFVTFRHSRGIGVRCDHSGTHGSTEVQKWMGKRKIRKDIQIVNLCAHHVWEQLISVGLPYRCEWSSPAWYHHTDSGRGPLAAQLHLTRILNRSSQSTVQRTDTNKQGWT